MHHDFSWFAVNVKARHEKAVASALRGKGYTEYLPLYEPRHQKSSHGVKVHLPLFTTYVFCRFDPLNRLPILTIPGVFGIVSTCRIPVPVDEAEIQAIQTVLRAGLPVEPWPRIEIGERVHITHGPLKGLAGVLLTVKGNHRLIVSVTLLGRSIAAEIDPDCVQRQNTSRTHESGLVGLARAGTAGPICVAGVTR